MDGKRHLGDLAETLDLDVGNPLADWPAPLGSKHVGCAGIVAPQLAQGTDFIATDGMH